jgi:outer membrane protein assembly factor BamB
MFLRHATLTAVVTILAASDARSADWARFRGPNGTGVATDTNIPVQWDESSGILWRVPIPGLGNSSPVISKGKLFLESAGADGKDRMLLCLDAKDGKTLWTAKCDGGKGKIHEKSSLASSTPAADGERVYAMFWDGDGISLRAYDYNGKELWKQELGKFKSQHGAGTSPVVYGGIVYLANDQDDAAELLAFDAKSGKPMWKKERRAFRACYSAPFILGEGDKQELIVASTSGVTAYEPKTGNENWDYKWSFTGMPLRTVASPIYHQGIIFACAGDGNGSRHSIAVRSTGKGDVTPSNLVWEKTRDTAYVPTMLAKDDYVFSVTDAGFARCYVAKTGEEVWSQRLGSGKFTASPIMIDGKIYAIDENGNSFVYAAAPRYQLLGKSAVHETVYASPAVADGKLYIRGQTHLHCIGKGG